MGFSASQAQNALLQVGAASVEMAMAWLLSNPEAETRLSEQDWNRYLLEAEAQLPFHLINIMKVTN